MADPKSPPSNDAEPLRFPAPVKAQGAVSVPQGRAGDARRAPPRVSTVSRPDPPAIVVPTRAVAPAVKAAPMPLQRDEPRLNPALAPARCPAYPRGVGTLLTLLFLYCFESSVVGDREKAHEALLKGERWIYVTKPQYLVLYVGAAAGGLWMMITSIPIEDKTGRPPDWWFLGLGVSVVLGVALREQLAGLMILLFAQSSGG